MKTKDIKLNVAYMYETSRDYGLNSGDRFYVLSHETYRTNPDLSWRTSNDDPAFVLHPRGSYLPYNASTGLLCIQVSGYTTLTEQEEALLRSVTLKEVLDGRGRLPERVRSGLPSTHPQLRVVQPRFLTGEWAVRNAEKERERKRANAAKEQRQQRLDAEKAEIEAGVEVLNRLLDSSTSQHYDCNYGRHEVRLTAKQVSQLAAVVKAALPSMFTD